jgi:hypothetical protein
VGQVVQVLRKRGRQVTKIPCFIAKNKASGFFIKAELRRFFERGDPS